MTMRRLLGCGLAALSLSTADAFGAEKIQPGAKLHIPPGISCTANFIYDGIGAMAGHTYVGVASHCPAADAPEGTLVSTSDGVAIGPLVVINWPLNTVADDYSLIEVLPERLKDVDPSVAGHPEWPTGVVTTADVSPGDLVAISGWGAGFDRDQTVRENRYGTITKYTDTLYDIVAPIMFGDSGGGLIHQKTGKALGIVSAYCVLNWGADHPMLSPCSVYGPTVSTSIERAAKQGFPTRMRLAGEPPPPPPAPGPAPASRPAPNGPPAAKPTRRPKSTSAAARRKACLRKAKRLRPARRRAAARRRCARIGKRSPRR